MQRNNTSKSELVKKCFHTMIYSIGLQFGTPALSNHVRNSHEFVQVFPYVLVSDHERSISFNDDMLIHSRFLVVPEYPIASPLPAHDVKSCAKFPLNAPPGVSHKGASGKEIISVAKSEKVEIAPIATPVIVAREICIMFFIAIKLLFTFIVPYSFLCCNNTYWQASNSFF